MCIVFVDSIAAAKSIPSMKANGPLNDFGRKPTALGASAGEQVASWATFLGNSVGGLKHYIAQMLGGYTGYTGHTQGVHRN